METTRISAFLDPNFYEVKNNASLRLTVHLSEGNRNPLRKWKKRSLSLSSFGPSTHTALEGTSFHVEVIRAEKLKKADSFVI